MRELPALMFDPEFEAQLSASRLGGDGATADPHVALRERVERYVKSVRKGHVYVVCTSPFWRQLSDLLERFGLRVDVFGFGELPSDISARPAAIISDPRTALM